VTTASATVLPAPSINFPFHDVPEAEATTGEIKIRRTATKQRMEVRLIQQIDIVGNYTGPQDIHSGFGTDQKENVGCVAGHNLS
jgi:hypothetical protein